MARSAPGGRGIGLQGIGHLPSQDVPTSGLEAKRKREREGGREVCFQ